MLKLAVIGAQSLLGRELATALETRASVVPLSTGPLTLEQEEGDLVIFPPEPVMLEGLDVVVLADDPPPGLLDPFQGRILDLRPGVEKPLGEPLPVIGTWPKGAKVLHGRPALEQVLALLPRLVSGLGEVGGTHLRAVAHLGDLGLEGLHAQTLAVLQGEDPDTAVLGYRAAFEAVPQTPRGSLLEVRVPVFHGDLLVLHLRAAEGKVLAKAETPEGVAWMDQPPSSRDVAVTSDLLAHFHPSAEGRTAVLTLGFDPILWGVLRPTMRVLGLMEG
ncbi:MAG TPA: hypothetical protein VJ600_09690 [Holophagaceae bacterium]|nr:hypothetical protein [Holophagaceae bacterium]